MIIINSTIWKYESATLRLFVWVNAFFSWEQEGLFCPWPCLTAHHCTAGCLFFWYVCIAPYMSPCGIKPCYISRWGQLQGCMCLHTQSPKIPKPVIRAAKSTPVLATAMFKDIGSRVQSVLGVCECAFWHEPKWMKKTVHACEFFEWCELVEFYIYQISLQLLSQLQP